MSIELALGSLFSTLSKGLETTKFSEHLASCSLYLFLQEPWKRSQQKKRH
jgi:hypothetical protein